MRLIGNVTRDPEVKYLQSGTAVCDLGIAVNERFKNRAGEWEDKVTFVDVTFFARTAEVAGEYVSKGMQLYVAGRLQLDQWEKDGKKFSKLKVVGDSMQMLGGKPQGERQEERPQQQRQSKPEPKPEIDTFF